MAYECEKCGKKTHRTVPIKTPFGKKEICVDCAKEKK